MSHNTLVHVSPSHADNSPHSLTPHTTPHHISICLIRVLFIAHLLPQTTALTPSPLTQHHITSQHLSSDSCSSLAFTRRQQPSLTDQSYRITSHLNMSHDTPVHLSPSPAANRPHSVTTQTTSHHISACLKTALIISRVHTETTSLTHSPLTQHHSTY